MIDAFKYYLKKMQQILFEIHSPWRGWKRQSFNSKWLQEKSFEGYFPTKFVTQVFPLIRWNNSGSLFLVHAIWHQWKEDYMMSSAEKEKGIQIFSSIGDACVVCMCLCQIEKKWDRRFWWVTLTKKKIRIFKLLHSFVCSNELVK